MVSILIVVVLPGSVRAQQPEQLPGADLERDAPHRLDVDRVTPDDAQVGPIGPDQVLGLDGERAVR